MTRETAVTDVYRATAEGVPSDATVRHYDELPTPLKERLPSLVDDAAACEQVPETEGTFVKFTDYYYLRCE
ncbi:hypothetical protein [Halorarius halobius]|uniref:hypothetical protein n=1 Tax=Halorarius halobius TaxID=2962671 RepID=UPI0020CB81AD|nr:hypothetical protein [Halorarius halobius]